MIDENTPDKLADIIRDTWPQLYRPMKRPYNNETVPTQKIPPVDTCIVV